VLSKLLNIGINDGLDLEDRAKVKLQNAMAFLGLMINVFFIFYHLFFSHKINVSIILFGLSFIAPLVFVFHAKRKYVAARATLFLFLYILIFAVSTILLVGHGNEYYYIALSILILVLNKNNYWTAIIILLNVFLYLLPHFYYPNIQEEYFVSTHIAVYASSLLSVLFFIKIQNAFRVKLREQKVHLEKLNDEKSDLISVVAHDLKSPLAQIQGLVNILKLDNGQLNQEQLQLIDKIKQVTDNQHEQISDFLSVKALEDSVEKLELEVVSVAKTIEQVLGEVQTLASAKDIKITDKSTSEELSILGSSEGLFKVISNLISNSIKYSFANTEITLDVKSIKENVVITVGDEGQGFTKEDLKLVFKKNQMLSAKPTANESSSGVGLYIIKKYVERMNGKVWLESEKGKGSTFFVSLPQVSQR